MNRATSWSWCCAATLPCASHTRRNAAAVRWNHSAVAARLHGVEKLVEEAPPPHAVAQARLIRREHEEHLLDQELRVVRIVAAAEAEEQVDLVDAREVARVRAAILLPADAVRLVVRPHAVEEAVDVELGEQHVVERSHVLERAARVVEQRLGDRMGDPDGRNPHQCVGRAHIGEDPASVVVEEEELVREGREALLTAVPREVVRGEVARREAGHDADGRPDVQSERRGLLVRRTLLARGVRELVAPE